MNLLILSIQLIFTEEKYSMFLFIYPFLIFYHCTLLAHCLWFLSHFLHFLILFFQRSSLTLPSGFFFQRLNKCLTEQLAYKESAAACTQYIEYTMYEKSLSWKKYFICQKESNLKIVSPPSPQVSYRYRKFKLSCIVQMVLYKAQTKIYSN